MQRTCLVVADAARARIFTYRHSLEADGPHEDLQEACDLVDSARRKRASDLFSDSAGSSHTGPHGYTFDDHRKTHLDAFDATFASSIVQELGAIAARHDAREIVVIASAHMLGVLRGHLTALRAKYTLREVERDLTTLPAAELRDRFADLHVLPPRDPRPGLAQPLR